MGKKEFRHFVRYSVTLPPTIPTTITKIGVTHTPFWCVTVRNMRNRPVSNY